MSSAAVVIGALRVKAKDLIFFPIKGDHTEKGDENENGRVASPENVLSLLCTLSVL